MNIIATDDEQYALKGLVEAISAVCPNEVIQGFRAPLKAIDYAEKNPVDVAFLDIEMSVMNGLELAKRLKGINPRTNIIFVTGFSEYAVDAFSIFASGYLLKPVKPDDIRLVLENLRAPIEHKNGNLIKVQCFGNFDIFADGKPIHFSRSKSKELLAYLIHKRGGSCTIRELAAVLFEDQEYCLSVQKQMQTVIASMLKQLSKHGINDLIIKKYNSLSVDISKLDCDYYKFLQYDTNAVNSYTGEFMSNYTWAEFTIGYLDSRVN